MNPTRAVAAFLRSPFWVAAALAVLSPPFLAAQTSAAPGGVIAGRVVNGATQLPLQGAVVTVEPAGRDSVLTGSDGRFRLGPLPPGEYTLAVSYTGLDTGRKAVAVGAQGTTPVEIALSSDVYQMEQFTISTVREGQALAINRQRVAPNVQNVVATDAFGNVADTNAGNLLIKLPGISPVRDEAEVYRVSVRGINSSLSSVSVDGTLLAGATTRGTDRSFEIDKVSTNSIESIEVIKSPTPDMDADSIGGKINLRTRSAFDRPGREIQYSAGANIYVKRGRSHPSGSLIYSDIFGADRRLGVSVSASFNRTFSPVASYRQNYLTPTFNAPAAISEFQTAEDDIRLDRIGSGVKLDYRLSDSTRLFLNTIYNNFEDTMRQHKQLGRLSNTGVLREVTDLVTEFVNGQYEYEMESRVRTVKTAMLQLGGRTELNRYEFNYDASYSRSHGTEKRENLRLFVNGPGFRVDLTNRRNFPRFTQISGPDVSNYDNAFTDNLTKLDYHAWDEVQAAQFNARRKLDHSILRAVKSGVRYRFQEKRQDRANDRWAYVGPDGVPGINNGVNDDNLNRFRDDGHRYSPVDGRYARPVWPNWDAMHEERRARPELFRFDTLGSLQRSLDGDNEASEAIYAAYVMGEAKVDRLSVVGGLRFERTETDGLGVFRDRSRPTIAEQFGTKRPVSGSYNNTFPGLHLKYEATPRLLLRASASTSVGRPDFGQLVPGTDIDTANRVVRQNNPSLRPQFADNYDFSAEYYFAGVGLASIGVFRKDITDFAFNVESTIGSGPNNGFDGEYAGYIFRTRGNGGWARVDGLELNYQQQFTFLPGFWNGLGAYANLTALRTEGTYSDTIVLKDIAGFVKRTGNLGLSYIKHNFTIRASLNFVGRHLSAYNANPALRQYLEPRSTVDFSVKYAYRPGLSVYIDGTNIFNERSIRYLGVGYRPVNNQIYGARVSAGISGTF